MRNVNKRFEGEYLSVTKPDFFDLLGMVRHFERLAGEINDKIRGGLAEGGSEYYNEEEELHHRLHSVLSDDYKDGCIRFIQFLRYYDPELSCCCYEWINGRPPTEDLHRLFEMLEKHQDEFNPNDRAAFEMVRKTYERELKTDPERLTETIRIGVPRALFIILFSQSDTQLRWEFEQADLFALEYAEISDKLVGNSAMFSRFERKIREKYGRPNYPLNLSTDASYARTVLGGIINPTESDEIFLATQELYSKIGENVRMAEMKRENRKDAVTFSTKTKLRALLSDITGKREEPPLHSRREEIRKFFLTDKIDLYEQFKRELEDVLGGFLVWKFDSETSLRTEIDGKALDYEEWVSERKKLDTKRIPKQTRTLRDLVLGAYSDAKSRALLAPILISKIGQTANTSPQAFQILKLTVLLGSEGGHAEYLKLYDFFENLENFLLEKGTWKRIGKLIVLWIGWLFISIAVMTFLRYSNGWALVVLASTYLVTVFWYRFWSNKPPTWTGFQHVLGMAVIITYIATSQPIPMLLEKIKP